MEIKNAVPLLGCDRLLVVRDIKQMQRLHWVINADFYYANILENNVVLYTNNLFGIIQVT